MPPVLRLSFPADAQTPGNSAKPQRLGKAAGVSADRTEESVVGDAVSGELVSGGLGLKTGNIQGNLALPRRSIAKYGRFYAEEQ